MFSSKRARRRPRSDVDGVPDDDGEGDDVPDDGGDDDGGGDGEADARSGEELDITL
ncbi:MAG: hypothetical protein ACP5PM_10350 [Acidimicrobiales bacterium]